MKPDAPAIARRPHPLLAEAVAWCRAEWGALPGRRALDLACGNGGDAVFLAEQGCDVEAWDSSPEALAATSALARERGVSVATRLVDLEANPVLPNDRWDLVSVFNFLHRPLVDAIRRAVRCGGIVVYETFLVEQRRLFGRPRRDEHVLTPGELAASFESWDIVVSREGFVAPDRCVASLIARKPLTTRLSE